MKSYFTEVVNSALEYFDYTTALWLAEQQVGNVLSLPLSEQQFARHQLAGVLVRMHQYMRVFDVLGDTCDIYSLYLKGLCCLNQDDLRGAEQHLSCIFKLYPDANENEDTVLLSHVTRLLGNVYTRTGREALAKQAYESSLHKNDSLYSVWETYVLLCNNNRMTSQTTQEENNQNGIMLSPFSQEVDDNTMVQDLAAATLSRDEDINMDEFATIRQQLYTACQLYLYVQHHKHTLIPALLLEMHKTTRQWPTVRCYVAASHYHLAFHSSCVHIFEQVVRDTPWCRTFQYLYSTSLWHQQQNDTLSHLAHKLQHQDKYSVEALITASNSASLQGSHTLALNFLERACTLYPNCAYAYTLRGLELQAIGRDVQGQSSLRIAIGKDPAQYTALCSIAIHCAESQSYQEAFLYIHNAIRVNPDNPVLQTYFARIRAFMDMHKNAITTLQRASKSIIENNPNKQTSLVCQTDDMGELEISYTLPNTTIQTFKSMPSQVLEDDIGLGSICTDMLRLLYTQDEESMNLVKKKELHTTMGKVKQAYSGDISASTIVANVMERLGMNTECEHTRATVIGLQGQAVNTKRKRKDALDEELLGWDIV